MQESEYHLKKDEQYRGLDIGKRMTREAFGETLVKLARKNENIVALTADLMYPTKLDKFAKEFPERFFNLGVAEQNMMGVAAGLATCGKIPFVTTFATFATSRALGQVRIDIAYTRLNVKIVGTAAGLSFAMGGMTHASTEDIAIIRSLANMIVIVPADALETEKATEAVVEYEGPIYLRLGRAAEPVIYEEDYEFKIGRSVILREGKDITLIATGAMVFEVLRASDELSKEGIQARVINIHTIKPIDKEAIIRAAKETKGIISVEEHNVIGGLGSAISEVLAEDGCGVPFKRLGLPDVFTIPGNPDDVRKRYGLNAADITQSTKKLLH